MKIKISDIKKTKPCSSGWEKFKKQIKPNQKLTTIEEIIKFNGVSDTLWIIGNVLKYQKALIKLSRQFADSVKHLNNTASCAATASAANYVVANYVAADCAAAVAANYAAAAADYAAAAAYAITANYAAAAERRKQEQMIIKYYGE